MTKLGRRCIIPKRTLSYLQKTEVLALAQEIANCAPSGVSLTSLSTSFLPGKMLRVALISRGHEKNQIREKVVTMLVKL